METSFRALAIAGELTNAMDSVVRGALPPGTTLALEQKEKNTPGGRRIDKMAEQVIVVGGGVIGLSCAWKLQQAGHAVTLIDPSPGRGASWVAAGMLAPVTEAHFGEEDLSRLLVAGAQAWPEFSELLEGVTDQDIGYRQSGTVLIGSNQSDREEIDHLVTYQRSLGLEVTRRNARECRALVPALSPSISGGADVPSDYQVDNRLLVEALLDGLPLLRRDPHQG